MIHLPILTDGDFVCRDWPPDSPTAERHCPYKGIVPLYISRP